MKKVPHGVPIAVVEQETGLSKDVLRKWETRYNYPVPDRDAHGDRIYSREQVKRLRTIKRLMDHGFRPSRLFRMSETELSELANSSQFTASDYDDATAVPELLAFIRKHQPMKLRAALKRLLQAQGLKSFVQDTIAPLSNVVGEAWSRGEIHVFDEHLYTDITSSTLRQALEAIDTPEGRPRILMTTLPGEVHSLGLLMAACLFTLRGAYCIYLGTETPGEDIARAADAHEADAIALSFSSAFPVRLVRPALVDLRNRVAKEVEIIAGGEGVKRQKQVEGVLFLNNLSGIDNVSSVFYSSKINRLISF